MDRERIERLQLGVGAIALSLPLGLFLYLKQRPALDRLVQVPTEHFYVVSATALLALALAVAVGLASVRVREPRTLFMAAAFLTIAGVFATHGLTTPGVIVHGLHKSILVSARLSLVLGGVFFALSAIEPPAAIGRWIGRHHGRLLGGMLVLLACYVGGNLARPTLLDWVPLGASSERTQPQPSGGPAAYGNGHFDPAVAQTTVDVPDPSGSGYSPTVSSDGDSPGLAVATDWLGYALAVVAIATLLFSAWRYYRVFSLSRLPAAATLSVGLILLAQSQISMMLGETWRLSWWMYHVLMLLGFAIPITGIAFAYARGCSLGTIVEGLFLSDALKKVEHAFPEAIDRLIAATEAKDPYLLGHARRVCALAVRIGEELKLSDARLRAVANGALLHDVGKLGLPDVILQKPGKLTDDEFAALKQHTVRGYNMVVDVRSLRSATLAIRSHHERLDGSGYPDGLIGEQIPIEARIVGVADVWDALTSDRVYRTAWSRAGAQQLLESEAGVRMDARCVAALFKVLDAESRPPPPVTLLYRRNRRAERAGAGAMVG